MLLRAVVVASAGLSTMACTGRCAIRPPPDEAPRVLDLFLTGLNHGGPDIDAEHHCTGLAGLGAVFQKAQRMNMHRIVVATTGGTCITPDDTPPLGNGQRFSGMFRDRDYRRIEFDQYNVTLGPTWTAITSTFVPWDVREDGFRGFTYSLITNGSESLPLYVVRFQTRPELALQQVNKLNRYAAARWSRDEMPPLVVGDFNLRYHEIQKDPPDPAVAALNAMWGKWATQQVSCANCPSQPQPMLFEGGGDLMNVIGPGTPPAPFACARKGLAVADVFYDARGPFDATPQYPIRVMGVPLNAHNIVAMSFVTRNLDPNCAASVRKTFRIRFQDVDDDAYAWFDEPRAIEAAFCAADARSGGTASCEITGASAQRTSKDYASVVIKFGNGGGGQSGGTVEILRADAAGEQVVMSKTKANLVRHSGWFYRAEVLLNFVTGETLLVDERECRGISDCPN